LIICPKCTKENQDHYKFCLGCGAELPRDASPRKQAAGTPPQGVRAVSGAPGPSAAAPADPVIAPAPAPVAAAAGIASGAPAAADAASPGDGSAGDGTVRCPQCDHTNPTTNKFCASCGFKLARPGSVPAPAGSVPPAGVPATPSQPGAAQGEGAPAGGAAAAAVPGQPPSPAALDPASFVPGSGAIMLTALRADGSEAGSYTLAGPTGMIGRDSGGIFAGDSYLSPRHATFTFRGGQWLVRDESSLNGVYRKLQREEPIELGFSDIFRIGQEILRVEPLTPPPKPADGVERMGSPSKGFIGRLALVIGRDATGNAYPVPEAGLHLGRERGDVLFPEDGYVSGLHCRISWQNGKLWLTDLGSSNGSFIRLQKETALTDGDVLLMGQQLFRVSL
jgi:pSer/pThr/pTyr-binding forkhead associated (FHA) protein